ncbi:MAG TPA: AlkA N-terminal domain-containing protein, partial [Kofleriaceae bacterium]|nr:AlkA N-terminal domain-containing protein [Kofleriaceae bacterium]
MELDPDTCHAALRARDRRFDGLFFVGVTSTGVYCRPICPARLPARQRCRFFARAAHAELAGFRACLRCRPELAPGRGAVDAVPALARAALARIDAGYLDERSVEALADRLGVTARHLRRSVTAELGASPLALAQTRRLALAKQLLHETRLPITDVAFAAGFASLRRFHAAFHARFGRPPAALRRAVASSDDAPDAVRLRLDHRPPLDWDALLAFLAARAIPGVEQVDGGVYRRTAAIDDRVGWLSVRSLAPRPALELTLTASLVPRLAAVVARVRALCDLDAHPAAIAAALQAHPALADEVAARPGLRVPGGFDGFELAVRAVLGQQVSVAAASTLAGRLVARLGPPIA